MIVGLRRLAAWTAMFSLGLANGCYSYLPAPRAIVTPRERVRIELTDEGTRDLARFLGPGVREAEGMVAHVDSNGAVGLAVDFVLLNNGIRMPWTGEGVVIFPLVTRQSVTRQTFQRGRTVIAAILLAAALSAVAVVALRSGDAGGGGDSPPPPPPP